ncbi:DGQHR domain-containing protein (plasmid) [Skermanella rosea]|uniref:DGQHR domain-containing protein DpdB n=1 Tax=Skermanella rosea TaxID=1817965 RepID=UPI001932E0C9|nr:DGQHR domain-containing protein DpdB [Skermanella rosea]UEM07112.1 DGQHR domain-containing protein [Skermanella rosea]
MSQMSYLAIQAPQSTDHIVVSFAATAEEILRFSTIDRVARSAEGTLSGFQRPQIASHIREIKDYLEKPDAVLPNPIVVAFTRGVQVESVDDQVCRVTIDTADGPPGFVVDGQQRLSALAQVKDKDFRVFVSALVCRDEAELRRQFVLINNTRPLPKSLIYELLPTVGGLPDRLDNRSLAAELTAQLNYREDSSLRGQIKQHTNPQGEISDTAIQRVIMNSLNDGVMREFIREPDGERRCFDLVNNFYRAVQIVFSGDWRDHKPRTSRLVHGAGISAMGYVMEHLAILDGARKWDEFAAGMGCLQGRTAWSSGEWRFADDDVRHWKAIQNLNKDIVTLAHYLQAIVRADMRSRKTPRPAPLLDAAAV